MFENIAGVNESPSNFTGTWTGDDSGTGMIAVARFSASSGLSAGSSCEWVLDDEAPTDFLVLATYPALAAQQTYNTLPFLAEHSSRVRCGLPVEPSWAPTELARFSRGAVRLLDQNGRRR